MSSYLEIQANKYAKKYIIEFDKKMSIFMKNSDKKFTEQECYDLYNEYKKNCIFTNLIRLSKIFEDNKKEYNYIENELAYAIDKDVFVNLYKNYLGNIYNKLFKKSYSKLSLIEKIDDSNIQIMQLYDCIIGRIQYHFNCREYTKKYNENSHKIEILISIYMYNRIKDIQKLLNIFKIKHNLFKERLEKEAEEKQKELKEFENLSIESTILSEPFIEINTHKRK